MTRKTKGSIIIPAGAHIWEHELRTAQVFAQHGHRVQFLTNTEGHRIKSADVLINDVTYEIKSPKANKLSAVERNLKRATKQSSNIIIDSRRSSKVHDLAIQKYLIQKYKQQKTIKKLLLVNRKHEVIDISKLV